MTKNTERIKVFCRKCGTSLRQTYEEDGYCPTCLDELDEENGVLTKRRMAKRW